MAKEVVAKKTTRVPRKKAAAKTSGSTSRRKAPTRSSAPTERKGDTTRMKTAIAFVIGAVIICGASVTIGMSDNGEIDVASTISQRAAVQEASGDIEGGQALRSLGEQAKQQKPTVPNGGLIGRGNKETEQQRNEERARASETASSTASSTDETATSSEAVADDAEAAVDDENESSEGVDGAEHVESEPDESGETVEETEQSTIEEASTEQF